MRSIPFWKYTSFGNNFVVLDETEEQSLSEEEKARFAYQATSMCFGVGSDNLLVIQRCTEAVLTAINGERRYWKELPDPSQADFVFRMFEPDGEEAYSCGNGLMSIATHLAQRYGVSSARILTEVPCPVPRPVQIGRDDDSRWSYANLGAPRAVPAEMVAASLRTKWGQQLDRVERLEVKFRQHDLFPFSDDTTLDISGYLVFTGEPHLVVFPSEVFSNQGLTQTVFPGISARVRRAFGSWLLHRIGSSINNEFKDSIPKGLNVNLALITEDGSAVEYRCFERGINRETLACGTGAIAVALACQALGYLSTPAVDVLPHRCRWFEPDAVIRIDRQREDWVLNGQPRLLFDGRFALEDRLPRNEPFHDHGSFDVDRQALRAEVARYAAVTAGGGAV